MKAPHVVHWEAALRVVRFLKGCPGQGILLRSDSNLELSVYVNADWSTCPLTRRSLSSYVVLLGGNPISWKTKKQKTVSDSSAEAEYRAMAAATKEMKWIVPLMKELGVQVDKPVPFFCDRNETFEKLGIIGTLSNLLVYLTSVFNMKSVTAATIINALLAQSTSELSSLLSFATLTSVDTRLLTVRSSPVFLDHLRYY
uniref:Reverse transcriptase Ty1/copia-type domain-containing protein n=1 Tax=Brassica campestris TaxID=3711 RepID=A0A3P5XV55_BRACM|nr:unnamed protein product [Brassica rapa]